MTSWQNRDSPATRFRKYLEKRGLWSEEEETSLKKTTRAEILKAFMEAEKVKKPKVSQLFTDVYDDVPQHLIEQQKDLNRLMEKYPQFYDQSPHEKE